MCVQAARRLKGEALQTQLSLCLAQREAQHWKWRAGLLQLQTASREEVLELSKVLQESTAEECASSKVRLAAAVCRETDLKVGCAVRQLWSTHALPRPFKACRQSLPGWTLPPSSRLISCTASRLSWGRMPQHGACC